jgi:hypothetical protein
MEAARILDVLKYMHKYVLKSLKAALNRSLSDLRGYRLILHRRDQFQCGIGWPRTR